MISGSPNASRLSRALRSGASRGGFKIVSSTLLGQVLGMVMLPLLARLYPPESFGVLSLVTAIVAVGAPVATLRLESALMLPRSQSQATSLLCIALISAAFLSFLAGLATFVLGQLDVFGDVGRYPFMSVWVASITLLTASFTALGQFALREKRYGLVASRTFLQSTATRLVQLLAAVITRTPVGLLFGMLLGRAVGIIPLLIASRHSLTRVSAHRMRVTLQRYRRFPLIFAPSALLNALGLQLPVLVAGLTQPTFELGNVGMADRLMAIPVTLIASSISQVLIAEYSARLRSPSGTLGKLFYKSTLFLSALGLLLVVAVFLLGGWLVEVFLGTDWSLTGRLLLVMVPAIAVRIVVNPTARILVLLERAALTVLLDGLRVVLVVIAAISVLAFTNDVVVLVGCMYGALALTYIATWVCTLFLVQRYDARIQKNSTA